MFLSTGAWWVCYLVRYYQCDSATLSPCLSSCDYLPGPAHPNKHSRGKIWMVIVIARTHIWEEFLQPRYLKGLWPPGSMPTDVSIKQNQRVTWHGMPWLRKSPDLLPSPKTVEEAVSLANIIMVLFLKWIPSLSPPLPYSPSFKKNQESENQSTGLE